MPSESGTPRSLLIVEDDDRLRERLARALAERGFETREAGRRAARGGGGAATRAPSTSLVDLRVPGGSGLDVVREIKAIDPATTIVVLTGYGSIATAVEAVRLGADGVPDEARGRRSDRGRADAPVRRTAAPTETARNTCPSLARVEWEHINRVLADCGGNISKAARLLGIHRRSLQRKLERFDVAIAALPHASGCLRLVRTNPREWYLRTMAA